MEQKLTERELQSDELPRDAVKATRIQKARIFIKIIRTSPLSLLGRSQGFVRTEGQDIAFLL